ncbi:DUF4291 family protein [Candidatus Marithrix sp. Canyon 246]
MTWIKTNFLWMMYRSEWGTKQGQETVYVPPHEVSPNLNYS